MFPIAGVENSSRAGVKRVFSLGENTGTNSNKCTIHQLAHKRGGKESPRAYAPIITCTVNAASHSGLWCTLGSVTHFPARAQAPFARNGSRGIRPDWKGTLFLLRRGDVSGGAAPEQDQGSAGAL